MANQTEDTIVCPYCNHQHSNIDDYLEVGDMSGEFKMTCERCSNWFDVEFYSVFHFTAKDRSERTNG